MRFNLGDKSVRYSISKEAKLFTRAGLAPLLLLALLTGCEGDTGKFKEAVYVAENNVTSITVSAVNDVIKLGESQQYQAKAVTADSDTTQDINSRVRWSTSDAAVASVSKTGLVKGIADGTVTITASLEELTATSTLVVSSAELTSISISASRQVVPVCTASTGLTAQGFYTDSTERDITQLVTWTTADATIATTEDTLLYAYLPGNATITASKDGVLSEVLTLPVVSTLTGITLTPENISLDDNDKQQYEASGLYASGERESVTKTSQWGVTDSSGAATDIAAMSNTKGSKGLLTAAKVGSGLVKVSCNEIEASTNLTVTGDPTVTKLEINDGATSVEISLSDGKTQTQLTADATFSDDDVEDVTEKAGWFVSSHTSGASASVSNSSGSKGLVTFTAVGETIIKANYEDATDQITVIVKK